MCGHSAGSFNRQRAVRPACRSAVCRVQSTLLSGKHLTASGLWPQAPYWSKCIGSIGIVWNSMIAMFVPLGTSNAQWVKLGKTRLRIAGDIA